MLSQHIRFGLCLSYTLGVVLPLAALSFRWIEQPGMALGKRVLLRMHGVGILESD
jgi:peptidoglycan/LPS O-acetylase OafA/YrhL